MAQIPGNQKLWVTLIAQAKAKGWSWPSPTAASWVHQHYVQMGGRFVESEKQVDKRFRDENYTKNKGEKKQAAARKQDEKNEKGKR